MIPYDVDAATVDAATVEAATVEVAPEPGSEAWWGEHAERLRRRRPRAGGLTVEAIVDAALDLADAEGLDALTVRSLAGRLETSSASLYRHVASVEELEVLMVDRVLGEVRPPAANAKGVDRILHQSREFRAVLLRHPGVVPALRSAPLLGPNGLASARVGFGNFLDAGLQGVEAAAAYVALVDYVLGIVFFDSGGSSIRGRVQFDDPSDIFGSHRADFAALDSDAVFEFGLRTFLRGLGLTVP